MGSLLCKLHVYVHWKYCLASYSLVKDSTLGVCSLQPKGTYIMSTQAIAQSATQLAESGTGTIDIPHLIKLKATRAIKNPNSNSTTERYNLNGSKLLNAVRMEWRTQSGGVARVPDEIDAIIQRDVSEFIMKQVNAINPSNALSWNRKDVLDFKNLRIVEKVTAIGQNDKELQAQLEAANRLLREANDKLAYYEKQDASGNSTTTKRDYPELIKRVKARIGELELTKSHIKGTLEAVKAATK